MTFLTDPRIFNFVLIGLYVCAGTRWALHGSWANTGYWCGALLITLCVTFGYQKP